MIQRRSDKRQREAWGEDFGKNKKRNKREKKENA
tara:strand:- start:2795 stop:2896 length:102 start_codon:yes stop_codon:yes gene_type:complete